MKSSQQIFLTFLICLVILLVTPKHSVLAVDDATNGIKLHDLLVQEHLELCKYMGNSELAQATCSAMCNIMKYDDGYCGQAVECLCRNIHADK